MPMCSETLLPKWIETLLAVMDSSELRWLRE
jgi:hypothetical protein